MRIKLVSLGKIRQTFVRDGEQEYLKRVRAWAQFETLELAVEKFAALPDVQLREKEGELFLKQLDKDDFLVVLDEHGKPKTSRDFARFVEARMGQGVSSLVFAIGGASGWSEPVKARADLLFSLSPMTFTYQMTRLILIEQIYRALTIIKHVPYHK